MKFRTSREHLCELLFIFALFFVFAVCAVTVLLVSASSYESTVRRTGENYDIRTTLTYLSQKIRQNDEYGAIHAGSNVYSTPWMDRNVRSPLFSTKQ